MSNNNQEFISPLPLYGAFKKKKLQEMRENHAKGIFNRKYKYTTKEKREAIQNWLNYFPDMAWVGKRDIGRLVGPFYIGIVFVTCNDLGAGFEPSLYASNMCEPEVKTGFSVSYTQNSIPVTYDWPEEVLEEYIKYQKETFFIQTEGPISLDDIFNFYVKLKNLIGGLSRHDAMVPTLIATWAGEVKKAEEYYQWVEDWMKTLPPKDDYAIYLAKLRELMTQPEKLRYNFIESVKALKLEKAAYQDIAGASYKEDYFKK